MAISTEQGTRARWWFDSLAIIRLTAQETGGTLSVVEVTEPAGAQAPLHVHHGEDETFCVLEGDVTLVVGDAEIHAAAGDVAFGPRDVPHRYTAGPEGCRMLFVCTPGGFEDLVVAMSRPAESLGLPPAGDEEPDFEEVGRIAAAHGCELLA
jgi:quercetin dioxygenase-like cupin family protein